MRCRIALNIKVNALKAMHQRDGQAKQGLGMLSECLIIERFLFTRLTGLMIEFETCIVTLKTEVPVDGHKFIRLIEILYSKVVLETPGQSQTQES